MKMRNVAIVQKSIFIFFIIVFNSNNSCYAQYACGSESRTIRGYNEWELLQAEACIMIEIDPIRSNELVKEMKIKTVTHYVKYSQDNERWKMYEHEYDTLGNLILTKSRYHYFTSASGAHSIEERYNYNDSTGYLSSIDYKHLGYVEPSPFYVSCLGCIYSEKTINYWPEDHLIESIEFLCDYDDEAKCKIYYRYYNNDLIKKIIYKKSGTFEYEISFVYEYYE